MRWLVLGIIILVLGAAISCMLADDYSNWDNDDWRN